MPEGTLSDEILSGGRPGGEQGSPVQLRDYWLMLLKHRWLIVVCMACSLAAAAAVSLLTVPLYQATAVLNVERDHANVADVGNTLQTNYDAEFIPTQTRLMTSREVAERAVKRLNLLENPEFGGRRTRMPWNRNGIVTPAISRVAGELQRYIEVRPIRGTNLVELAYTAHSPQMAADVANALCDAYIDWNLESKFEVVGQASRFLTTQVEQLKNEIDQKEAQLQTYGRSKDIISADPQTNATLQNLESLNKEYADAVADRVAKEAKFHEVQTARPDTIADTLSNGVVAGLRADISRLEREYADKLTLYRPEWPGMIQLKSQIDKTRQNLTTVTAETVAKVRDVARSEYLTALRREESLKSVLQGQKSEAMNLKSNEIEYTNLRVEVDTKRALLDTLLKRQAETELTSRLRGERLSNIRVVDRALPPETRFKPSYKANGMLGILFGAALGLGLAFLFEYLDRSIRNADQVESFLRLPALGVIPSSRNAGGKIYGYSRQKKKEVTPQVTAAIELLPELQPRSFISEAYRDFRASLLLSQAGGVRTIGITSSVSSEGKSSTATNLAVVLAQLGKRVLLVDADLHRPRLHEIFKVSNRSGLVSILVHDAKPSEIILKTQIEGVYLLPSGPHSPNPSALLASDLMARLAKYASQNFDFVVFDTPPIAAVADALIVGQLSDGIVLCIRGGKTPRELAAHARDRILRSNIRILGVLINNLDQSALGYGYQGNYRYAGYYADPAATGEGTTTAARSGRPSRAAS